MSDDPTPTVKVLLGWDDLRPEDRVQVFITLRENAGEMRYMQRKFEKSLVELRELNLDSNAKSIQQAERLVLSYGRKAEAYEALLRHLGCTID